MVHPHVVVPLLQRGKLSHQLPRDVQDLRVGDEVSRGGGDDVEGTGHEFAGVCTLQGRFPEHRLNAVALQLGDVAVGEVAGKVDLEAGGAVMTKSSIR